MSLARHAPLRSRFAAVPAPALLLPRALLLLLPPAALLPSPPLLLPLAFFSQLGGALEELLHRFISTSHKVFS